MDDTIHDGKAPDTRASEKELARKWWEILGREVKGVGISLSWSRGGCADHRAGRGKGYGGRRGEREREKQALEEGGDLRSQWDMLCHLAHSSRQRSAVPVEAPTPTISSDLAPSPSPSASPRFDPFFFSAVSLLSIHPPLNSSDKSEQGWPNPLPRSVPPMTSIYHCTSTTTIDTTTTTTCSPPDFADLSPPQPSSASLPKSLRPRRHLSDDPPSEPLPLPSLSPNIYRLKSDADRAFLETTSSDANPSASLSRPRVSPRESAPRSQPIPVIHSTRPGLAFPTSPRRTPRPLSRRPSTPSAASSSSDSSPPPSHSRTPQHNTAGIGRKVADSLQLFKESVSLPATEIINPLAFSRTCSPSRRRISSHTPVDDDDLVIGTHFEFVKRADWQEREAAVLRRERSSLTLDRPRAREGVVNAAREHRESVSRRKERADPLNDGGTDGRTQSTKDLAKQRDPRGRVRDRQQRFEKPSIVLSTPTAPRAPSHHDLCLTPIMTSPSSCPVSLPRSPSVRIPIPIPQRQPSSDFATPSILSTVSVAKHELASEISHSRSPTPVRTVPQLPSHPLHRDPVSTPSPWSTDDESAWESASVTSTTSTSSPPSPPEPLESNPDVTWSMDNEYHGISRHTSIDQDVGIDEQFHIPFDPSEVVLPHIPLRPFRNQVGGHSSIYKFTKRAVCKVRVTMMSFTCLVFI